MLDKSQILSTVSEIFSTCPGNLVSKADALSPQLEGLALFEAPIVGVALAEDPLFQEYKQPGIVGPWHLSPEQWLPGAKSVVSLFFPFTQAVKESNRSCTDGPSPAWLHGRIEGQAYITAYMSALREWFCTQGVACCVPAMDPRFKGLEAGKGIHGFDGITERTFGSNWSERHAAFACGLGTFGLSKGLITRKGMAGRFASIIVALPLPADPRPYTDPYEYCTRCGSCIPRCPVDAITLEHGKDHNICSKFQKEMAVLHAPRYGCGLCQVKVPCESGIPGRPEPKI